MQSHESKSSFDSILSNASSMHTSSESTQNSTAEEKAGLTNDDIERNIRNHLLPTVGAGFHLLTKEEYGQKLLASELSTGSETSSIPIETTYQKRIELLYPSYVYFSSELLDDKNLSEVQAQAILDYFQMSAAEILSSPMAYRAILLAKFRLNKLVETYNQVQETIVWLDNNVQDSNEYGFLYYLSAAIISVLKDSHDYGVPWYDKGIAAIYSMSKHINSSFNKDQIVDIVYLYQLFQKAKHGIDPGKIYRLEDLINMFQQCKKNRDYNSAVIWLQKISAVHPDTIAIAILQSIECIHKQYQEDYHLVTEKIIGLSDFLNFAIRHIQQNTVLTYSPEGYAILAQHNLLMLMRCNPMNIQASYEYYAGAHDSLISIYKKIYIKTDADDRAYAGYKAIAEHFTYLAESAECYRKYALLCYEKALTYHDMSGAMLRKSKSAVQNRQRATDISHDDEKHGHQRGTKHIPRIPSFPPVPVNRSLIAQTVDDVKSEGQAVLSSLENDESEYFRQVNEERHAQLAAKRVKKKKKKEKKAKDRASRGSVNQDVVKENPKKPDQDEISNHKSLSTAREISEISVAAIRDRQLEEAKDQPSPIEKLASALRTDVKVNLTTLDVELLAIKPDEKDVDGINAMFGGTVINRIFEKVYGLKPGTLDNADTDVDMQTGYKLESMKRAFERKYGPSQMLLECRISEYDPSLLRLKIRYNGNVIAIDVKYNADLVRPNPNFEKASQSSYARCVSNFITIDSHVHDGTKNGFTDLIHYQIVTLSGAEKLFTRDPSCILTMVKLRARLDAIAEQVNIPNRSKWAQGLEAAMTKHASLLMNNPGKTNMGLKKIFFHANPDAIRCLFKLAIFNILFPEFMILFEDDSSKSASDQFYNRFTKFMREAKEQRNTSLFIVYDFLLKKLQERDVSIDLNKSIAQNILLKQQYEYIISEINKKPDFILSELTRCIRFNLPLQNSVLAVIKENASALVQSIKTNANVCQRTNGVLSQLINKKNIDQFEKILEYFVLPIFSLVLPNQRDTDLKKTVLKSFKECRTLGKFYGALAREIPEFYNSILFSQYRGTSVVNSKFEERTVLEAGKNEVKMINNNINITRKK